VRLTPGTRIGPYEVVALLGAGGMAEVYRAKDTRLGRDVAIKVVSEALGADGAFLERFEREAKLAAALAHPNVVALHDVGFHDGKPYFVTELLEGETLRERLARGPLPSSTALEWAAQIAQGLSAAHERGIAHRDLKPENVFITRDGHVKVLDFGIAKLVGAAQGGVPHGLLDETVSSSGSSTSTGMVLGTPGYMSPEQVQGNPVDARTDFFSLGSVLYEMLCGRRAFAAGAVVESGYAILHNEPEALPANVPSQVAQVVQRCLQKDPARRFQSARDLAFNLELVRTSTGSTNPTGALSLSPAKPAAWRRGAWPVVALLAVLGSGAAMYFAGRATRLPTPSVQSLISRLGRVSAGRFNPDGRIIFSAAWDGQPLELFAQSPGSTDAQPLGLHDMALMAVSKTGELAVLLRPSLGPNGVLFGTLAVVPGAGGTPREVAEKAMWADWSPAGELVVVLFRSGRMQLEFPLGRKLYQSDGLLVNPRVSPTGELIAFSDTGTLKLVDRRGETRTLVPFPQGFGLSLAWTPRGDEVWFTKPGGSAIWAAGTGAGENRLVYQGISQLALEDISQDGRVLVNASEARREVAFAPAGKSLEKRLSVYNSDLVAVSEDARQVLMSSEEAGINLQPTDGAPPLKLGPGTALALSPDAKWVLAQEGTDDMVLLPVGPLAPRKLGVGDMEVNQAGFLHDGNRIAFVGRHQKDPAYSLFVMPLDGGTPVAFSDAGVFGHELIQISPDDGFVAAMDAHGMLTLYPLDGGAPVPLSDLGDLAEAAAWESPRLLWVRPQPYRELPKRILLYDVAERRVLGERAFSLNDAIGILAVEHTLSTPDAGAIAFDYDRVIGHLYLLDGLLGPRR
jgi:eukaryotic-like serine/threonine-protein kinase